MDLILLRSTDINNDPSSIMQMIEFLFGLMGDVVKAMRTIYLFKSGSVRVSLFDFLIVLAVMSIVITYLVNVARRPTVESGTAKNKRISREKRGNNNA